MNPQQRAVNDRLEELHAEQVRLRETIGRARNDGPGNIVAKAALERDVPRLAEVQRQVAEVLAPDPPLVPRGATVRVLLARLTAYPSQVVDARVIVTNEGVEAAEVASFAIYASPASGATVAAPIHLPVPARVEAGDSWNAAANLVCHGPGHYVVGALVGFANGAQVSADPEVDLVVRRIE